MRDAGFSVLGLFDEHSAQHFTNECVRKLFTKLNISGHGIYFQTLTAELERLIFRK